MKIATSAEIRSRAWSAMSATWATVLSVTCAISLISYAVSLVTSAIPGVGELLSLAAAMFLSILTLGLVNGMLGYLRGRFITFDSALGAVNDRCVGSHRYEVEAFTEGGHSFGAFGKKNAIAVLSGIVSAIYALDVPQKDGCRTTYNVGTIEGGTSVNTIAQSARMLCEYRSDDRACLAAMERAFAEIFAAAQGEDAEIRVTRVGERPCGAADDAAIDTLKAAVLPVIETVTGEPVVCRSASTDCNIPLSLGIPALCVGITRHSGIHTRQETLDKRCLDAGLEIAIRLALSL